MDHTRPRLRYAVIGAGMAGILAGVRLGQQGEDYTIFEKADQLGGTWRENRYPGLTCDVPAHAYTYSFAPYAEWHAYYATGGEIKSYFEQVAEKYGVLPHIRFGCEVVSTVWDEERSLWRLGLSTGETVEAEIVIAASGVLHHPRLPDIEGRESFAGKAFHSARWDDDAPLDGARVGVIGNGSTGVQIITALKDRAAHLVHFQRSPQWIMPVPYFEYSEEEREAFRNDPALIDAIRYDKEYWENIFRFTRAITDVNGPEIAIIEQLCLDNLENSVRDPELREKLRPDYRAACKRLIYSWSYYDAVQHLNVSVEREGIARIEPEGVRLKDGRLIELDTIVFATGFHADRFIRPTQVLGRGGVSLDDVWAQRPTAYYAIGIPDFPNFFMLNGPTGPVGNFSLIDIAERQWGYIEQLLEPLRTGEARTIEPSAQAHADYEERRIAAAKTTIFGSGCQSWYLDATGVPASWPWSYEAFADAMAKPVMADYRIARREALAE
ncbi:putative monooxygenase [Sphingobium jiangsuense]|uniref:Cation diffusion facilitator CzcD-associated flavoprotein CzcO n=1 Tax=Sphingobium jiangsuense TaxID=870476 RepID=A0A7W6BN88_9SPHN|nr:NAD(P)/FAD-dependent oxidoreductase [Sphingobium jiangsuense]MBB3926950.1 cation diffusion facilitator CzcD-associated flavoprotein CzcO [Sphingobium jiangsuense]GLT02309.1 putative monooxygenase [Sphingobium jiangsuense]